MLRGSTQLYENLPPGVASRLKVTDHDILIGLAEGETHYEIACLMGVSEDQVNNRVVYLRKIFICRTTAQLVAQAYHYGILKPKS